MLLCHEFLDFMEWLMLLFVEAYDSRSVLIPCLRHGKLSVNSERKDGLSWGDVGVDGPS
jgi:hypothetical protein